MACDKNKCYDSIRDSCSYDQVGNYPGKTDKEKCQNCILANVPHILPACLEEDCKDIVDGYCQDPPSITKHFLWIIGITLVILFLLAAAFLLNKKDVGYRKKLNAGKI